MSPSDLRWTVGVDAVGVRLDKFLAAADRLGSRSRAVAAIERGKVFVNDTETAVADAAKRLSQGDSVRAWMDRPGSSKRRPGPHRTADLDILYEDDDIIAINKPPGLLAVPLERKSQAESVFDQLDRHLRSHRTRRPFTVHRIDRDTSGIVVFAKHQAAQGVLKQQFLRREPERVYLAVVYGHPTPPSGTWRDHLVWDQRSLIQKRTHPRDPQGTEAISDYRVVERYQSTSLVEIRLVTGKRNQIRIQARLRGHTLVGEQRYVFGPSELRPISFGRQALHASRLTVKHPATGRTLTFDAPLPRDMKELLAALRTGTVLPTASPAG
ncbi:MAG TPA: RluA family pseudouridine synthase [Vicinamibacterales bacterium]|nr:RluA family pseudouridine synthase [Vicinamibacterales bacterium]